MLNFGSIPLCFHLLYFLVYVQPLMQDSMVYGDFMASAHTSVNVLSAKYNHNKRQYNYTTPNSFLEQIMLYNILLDKKKRTRGCPDKWSISQMACRSFLQKEGRQQTVCHNLFFHSL